MSEKKVIDWDEAMNQVGGDKEFLNEVLGDLIQESETAQEEIEAAILVRDYGGVMKAAHRIKGSASYLCCDYLKEVSLILQDQGLAAQGFGSPESIPPELVEEINVKFADFKQGLIDLKKTIEEAALGN